MNKKIPFILIVSLFLLSIISINVEAAPCNTVLFCGGDYEINCKAESDGYCPEKFGDWSTCDDGKCSTCDENCETCGSIAITNDISCKEPGSTLNIDVTASFNSRADYSKYKLWLFEGLDPTPKESQFCTGLSCSNTFTDTLSSTGGSGYSYTATTNHWKDKDGVDGKATETSYTSPNVLLSVSPSNNNEVKEVVNVIVEASTSKKIDYVEVHMFKEDKNGDFQPVFLEANGGDCSLRCIGATCNRLGRAEGNDATSGTYYFPWDTLKCDNKDFKIIATVKDKGTDTCSNTNEIILSTANVGEPCVDDCPEFKTGIFESLIAKIKTFI